MAVDLNNYFCAMCGTRLTDDSSIIKNEGTLYCCSNCFIHATQPASAQVSLDAEHCAQCGLALLATETRVRRGINSYCCNNCANAREREQVGHPV